MRLSRAWMVAASSTALAASDVSRANEIQSFTYDALGRLIAVDRTGTVNNGQKQSICYDSAGNRSEYKSSSSGVGLACTTGTPPPPPPPPPPVTISISDAEDYEGANLIFIVSLSGPSTSAVTVNYATAVGTAAANDFIAASGTLTFSPGETVKTIAITARTDTRAEVTESFYVNLSAPSGGASIADGQGIGLIDDDGNGGCPTC